MKVDAEELLKTKETLSDKMSEADESMKTSDFSKTPMSH
jgi:hypothetical protein